jgi:hypothetical protein
MQLSDLTGLTFETLFGRLLRRALGAVLLAAFAVIALYYANGAGTVALTAQVGLLYAYMIMAAIYAVFALIVLTVLMTTRTKKALVVDKPNGALANPRNMQIAMLVEAVMLGYSLSRKSRLP